MRVCVYCIKNDAETTFIKSEHVIPRLFGVFNKPVNNPTIINYVCDQCNSNFSLLETYVKEDTEEGIFFQMLNLTNSYQIRIRGEKVKTNFCPGFGDNFFNEIFPLLKIENGKQVIELKSQIKLKRYSGYYYIFLIDELKKILNKKKEVERIKKIFNSVDNKDIRLFVGGAPGDPKPFEKAINLLNSLRTNPYREGVNKTIEIKEQGKLFAINMDCAVDPPRARIFAKIAFNYFIFSAIEGGMSHILYNKNFEKIKKFILNAEDVPLKDIIESVDERDFILIQEKMRNKRLSAHQIIFYNDRGRIIAEVVILGKRIYKIIIGNIFDEINVANFGSGHLFDPYNHVIHNLTPNPTKFRAEEGVNFGLFRI